MGQHVQASVSVWIHRIWMVVMWAGIILSVYNAHKYSTAGNEVLAMLHTIMGFIFTLWLRLEYLIENRVVKVEVLSRNVTVTKVE